MTALSESPHPTTAEVAAARERLRYWYLPQPNGLRARPASMDERYDPDDEEGQTQLERDVCVLLAVYDALTAPTGARGGETANNWQPIETAPRDGTHILACDAFKAWTFSQRPPTVVHYWATLGEDGFYTSVSERAPERPFPATHWMPLPAPPSVARTPASRAPKS